MVGELFHTSMKASCQLSLLELPLCFAFLVFFVSLFLSLSLFLSFLFGRFRVKCTSSNPPIQHTGLMQSLSGKCAPPRLWATQMFAYGGARLANIVVCQVVRGLVRGHHQLLRDPSLEGLCIGYLGANKLKLRKVTCDQ